MSSTPPPETRVVVPREVLSENTIPLVALGDLIHAGVELGAYADVADYTRGSDASPLTFSLSCPEEPDALLVRRLVDLVKTFRNEHGIDLHPTVEGGTVVFTVPGDVIGKHGRRTTYSNNSCHDPLCQLAQTRRLAEQKERRRQKLEALNAACDPKVRPHGTPGGYSNHGCRGDACTAAWNSEAQARRHLKKALEAQEMSAAR